MSEHDQWLEFQTGCDDQMPSCAKCGYELCEHHLCRHCDSCVPCEEEEEQVAKKPAAPTSTPARQRRAG